MTEKFFDEQLEQSQIKAEIVSKYFFAWAKVIIGWQKKSGRGTKVSYMDLFAGPGRYKDGAKSTPLMILEKAIEEPDFCERLVALFNDRDGDNSSSLKTEIFALPGIERLKYKPEIYTSEIDENVVKYFESRKLDPTFLFVDPFGYKGLSLRLVQSVVKNWGCDCVFFFNYGRINAGLSNEAVFEHMFALFGKDRATALRERFESTNLRPSQREEFIVDEMRAALVELGGQHVMPFRFRNPAGTRTTHYLFFVSKSFRGFEIMRDIMYAHSQKEQGVAKFEYNPADAQFKSLFEYIRPLEELEELLLDVFAGKTVSFSEVYETHSVGRGFVKKNYRDVMCRMELDGKLRMEPQHGSRKAGTIGEKVKIIFPRR